MGYKRLSEKTEEEWVRMPFVDVKKEFKEGDSTTRSIKKKG